LIAPSGVEEAVISASGGLVMEWCGIGGLCCNDGIDPSVEGEDVETGGDAESGESGVDTPSDSCSSIGVMASG